MHNKLILNRYIPLRRIGSGATSNVFLVKDITTGTKLAMKIAKKESSLASSLKKEALLMKTLRHEGIPMIQDCGGTDEQPLIIMEYIDGQTLEKILKQEKKITQKRAVEITLMVCDVLVYLHEGKNKIIYRDLKPSNVMISKSGSVYLMDFGAARYYEPHAVGDTQSIGTKGYAAPEQYGFMGQTDPRCDVYCLGIMLLQMLTGVDPTKHEYGTIHAREVDPFILPPIAGIIDRCIDPDITKRYQNIKEVIADLISVDMLSRKFIFRVFMHVSTAALFLFAAIITGIYMSDQYIMGNEKLASALSLLSKTLQERTPYVMARFYSFRQQMAAFVEQWRLN